MLKYPLYNMNDIEFEYLATLICEKILGIGTIIFSTGKDGGRDAKFNGKAGKFPSEEEQWNGKIIIQAKHTSKPTASCSDSDFNNILNEEIPKINELKQASEIDYYLIFTNRKLSSLKDMEITKRLLTETRIPNQIIGLERINLWLQEFPDITKTLNLNRFLLPINIYEKDIQELIVAFADNTFYSKVDIKDIENKFHNIPIEEKNRLNNLSENYFNEVMRESYSDFNSINSFLCDPINFEYKKMYENTISDLKEEITINREQFGYFEEILNYFYKFFLNTLDQNLLKNRKKIRIFLHFMYCNCDIGIKVDNNVNS